MDYLWSPWRYQYVSGATRSGQCIFCEMASGDPSRDSERFILHRGRFNLVVLNIFPYTPGHSLIAPYKHVPNLTALGGEELSEMMILARDLEGALQTAYRPEGLNLGMNLGRSAGAGIADHVHMHVLPRWAGDSNFMTVVGETRVLPEDLSTTYEKLAALFHVPSTVEGDAARR